MQSNSNKIGLYVHIPFCRSKCPYCDFYSLKHDEETEEKYIKAILEDMQGYSQKGINADSLYFGGGTPSIINPKNIELIINKAKDIFSLEGEITTEANPNSVTKEKLIQYKNAGINRISFGMQSGDEKELKALGRLHSKDEVFYAVNTAFEVGIENISVDLMLGTPYQTIESLDSTIEFINQMPVSHVSAYMLKVEEGTRYYKNDILKYCANEDELSTMYLFAVEKLEAMGLMQYEISNFARSDKKSFHNLKYWKAEEYLGFGASAHSFYNNKRFCNPPDINNYIANKSLNAVVTDDSPDHTEEYIMLNLRLKDGISIKKLCSFGDESKILFKLKQYEKHGLARIGNDKFSLTPTGFLVSNSIIADIISII